MSPEITPTRLDLKKDERLEIDWQDGRRCVYKLEYLRMMCPCAQCKLVRENKPHVALHATPLPEPGRKAKPVLTILPGNYAEPLRVLHAEMVGNYAIRIDWSDQHASGIYSFQYLREICPA